jgi:hypothetical protein
MKCSPARNGWKAIWAVAVAVAAITAVVGTPSVTYWAAAWVNRPSYYAVAFQIEDTWLSGSQRNSRRFWMAKGKVESSNEVLSMRWKGTHGVSPFKGGESVQVRYNPNATAILFNGRSLRVLLPDDYLAAGRNLVTCAAGFFGPGLAVVFAWLFRSYRSSSSLRLQHTARAAVAMIAIQCGGCGRNVPWTPATLESLSGSLKASYEGGDTNALIAQIATNSVPPILLEAMKQSLLLPVSLGKVEVQTVRSYAVSEYQPTTGVPGVYEGKRLRWAVMPTHWIVLETSCHPLRQAESGRLSTKIKMEFAVAEIDGRWRIIGPVYGE